MHLFNIPVLSPGRRGGSIFCLLLGSTAFLASVGGFVLARSSGISPVTAHVLAAVLSSCVVFLAPALIKSRDYSLPVISSAYLLKALVAWLISASVQGGIFQIFRDLRQIPDYLSFMPAGICGVLVCLMLACFWIFPSQASSRQASPMRVDGIVFIVAAIVLRLVYLGLPELLEQEAYYWNYAQHPSLSYLDHPPLVAWMIWFGTRLFGVSEFGVRIGAFACWLIGAFFVHRLTRDIFDGSAARGAVLLFAVLPFYFGVGFLMTPDAPLHAAWAALLYFLYRALRTDDAQAWIGIGVSLGLGMLAKYTIVLLGPAIVCFMLVDRQARHWFCKPQPYLAALLACIIFLPVIIWNGQHDWVSFLFQSKARLARQFIFSTHLLLGYIVLMLTPAGLAAGIMFYVGGGRVFKSAAGRLRAQIEPGIDRTYLLLLLLSLAPLLVFLGVSFTREVKPNWTSPVWLALLPFLGYTLNLAGEQLSSFCYRAIQAAWRMTIPILLCGFAIGLHHATLGLPGLPHPPGPLLFGWDGLAAKVELLVEQAARETGRRPIVVGMDHYQMASGLAFYRTKNALQASPADDSRGVDETVGWHLFGYNSRMYRYWYDPASIGGLDVIAFASKRSRLEDSFFPAGVVFKSEIEPIDAEKDGQAVRRFYYRILSLGPPAN